MSLLTGYMTRSAAAPQSQLAAGGYTAKGGKKMVRKNARTCAMRGRNPDNPSDRRKGCPTEQRIEIGGVVLNCLTTVSKDTLVFCKVVYEKSINTKKN